MMKTKNIRILMAALVLITVTSCQKEEIRTLKATFEQYESNGKAYIDDDYYACWEDDDAVAINGHGCSVTLATDNSHASSAEITIPPYLNGQNLLAFYPANKISDMSATGGTVDFPHIQTYRENADGKQIIDNPMAAYCPSDGDELKFHNLGSLLKVTIPNNEDIKAIQVKGIDNQMLCGKAQIWFNANGELRLKPCTDGSNSVTLRFPEPVRANGKSFYIVLPPNTNFETLTIAVLSNSGTAWATHAKTASLGNILPANHIATISYDISHYTDYNFVADWTIRYTATAQVTPNSDATWGTYGADDVAYNFSGSSGLIVFNDIITTIGYGAFREHHTLQTIRIPESVVKLENLSFNECGGLTSVSLPGTKRLGTKAFYGCTNLASVSIPKVTTAGQWAFAYCASLTSIDMPCIDTIGYGALQDCTLLESVVIPHVNVLEYRAFYNCTSLAHVYSKTISPVTGIEVWTYVSEDAILHRPSTMGGSIIPWSDWPGLTALDYDD